MTLAKYLFRKIIWNIPTQEKILYLTFDDGPTPEITEWTLSALKKFNAKATFFCVGNMVDKYPEIFQKIIAGNHSVGNHTHNHLNGWKTKTKEYFSDIEKCNSSIFNHPPATCHQLPTTNYPAITDYQTPINPTPLPPTPLFRPPYGKLTLAQYSTLNKKYAIVMWDILSGDFSRKISGEQCFQKVVRKAKNGSIIVFHDSPQAAKNLWYVLPKFLELFSAKGFRFEKLP